MRMSRPPQPLVTVTSLGAEYRLTFHLADGPHVRYATGKAQADRLIQRILPGTKPDEILWDSNSLPRGGVR